MKKLAGFGLFLLILISSVQAQESEREFEMVEGDTTFVMKQYFMCFLLRGPQADTFSEEELSELQKLHLENINRLAEEGKVIIAGPFGDDTEKRGILIFDVATQEEAEEAVKTDPMVKKGRLTYEIHPWWAAKGSTLR